MAWDTSSSTLMSPYDLPRRSRARSRSAIAFHARTSTSQSNLPSQELMQSSPPTTRWAGIIAILLVSFEWMWFPPAVAHGYSSWQATADMQLINATAGHGRQLLNANTQKPPLLARQIGTALNFKILQFADLHFTGNPSFECRDPPKDVVSSDCKEALMTQFMNDVLDIEKPDMVVFTGDNVETFDTDRQQDAIDYTTNPVEERGIPWAMVFGNHDDENGFPRQRIFMLASAKNHSYIQRGPEKVDGIGNYELSVMDPNNTRAMLRLYFLDSHGYPNKTIYPETKSTYDWVKPSQIAFYKQLSESHRNDRVPAMMFFHIPIPEYNVTTAEPPGDVAKALSGEQNERVSSSSVDTKLFSTLVEQREVKAVFVGHDHLNEYCGHRQGIQLCYGGGSGFGRAYGSESFARRVRVIEWCQSQHGVRTIRSWKRHHDSLDQVHHLEKLYEDGLLMLASTKKEAKVTNGEPMASSSTSHGSISSVSTVAFAVAVALGVLNGVWGRMH